MASGACGPDEWQPTGGVEVKGKGRMETYLWREEQLEQRCTASSAVASGVWCPASESSMDAAESYTHSQACHSKPADKLYHGIAGGSDRDCPTLATLTLDSLRIAPCATSAALRSNALGFDFKAVTSILDAISCSCKSSALQLSGVKHPLRMAAAAAAAETEVGVGVVGVSSSHTVLAPITVSQCLRAWGANTAPLDNTGPLHRAQP